MHDSVLAFVAKVLTPGDVAGRTVLEVGSAMINGSVRPQIEAMGPASYTGLDLAPGPGVDIAEPMGVEYFATAALASGASYDLVVSCEMLEHAERWVAAFRAMANLVAPGGKLVLTCRGPGFPFHNPPDHWRFTPSDLWRAAVLAGLWPTVAEYDPQVPGAFLVAERAFGADSGPLQPHATAALAGYPDVLSMGAPATRRSR